MMLILIMVIMVIALIATAYGYVDHDVCADSVYYVEVHNLAITMISMRMTSLMRIRVLIVFTDDYTGNDVYAHDDDSDTGYSVDNGERHDLLAYGGDDAYHGN